MGTVLHSWERGANEKYNGLLRQYFPKYYNFDYITEGDILSIEEKLNNRPRKRFGYSVPKSSIFTNKLLITMIGCIYYLNPPSN